MDLTEILSVSIISRPLLPLPCFLLFPQLFPPPSFRSSALSSTLSSAFSFSSLPSLSLFFLLSPLLSPQHTLPQFSSTSSSTLFSFFFYDLPFFLFMGVHLCMDVHMCTHVFVFVCACVCTFMCACMHVCEYRCVV